MRLGSSFAALLLVLASTLPAMADVRYTVRVSVREAGAPANPVAKMIGDQLVRAIAPDGSTESTIASTDEAVRIEFAEDTPTLPKGSIMIRRVDGSGVVLNPAEKTYWALRTANPNAAASNSPDVKTTKTGKSARIAGVTADQVMFTVELKPQSQGRPLPVDLPLTIEGEIWVARDVLQPKAGEVFMTPALRAFGLDTVAQGHLVMRQIIRGPMLGGRELTTEMISLDRKALPPTMFETPAGFTEVPRPQPRAVGTPSATSPATGATPASPAAR